MHSAREHHIPMYQGGKFLLGHHGLLASACYRWPRWLHLVAPVIVISSASAIVYVIIVFVNTFGGLFKFHCSCTVGSWGRVAIQV